jgi:N6-L-threonylcarbamoyladenine synthase
MVEAELEFRDLAGVAATAGPGLIGGLLVGLITAKAIAAAHRRPLLAINHLEGHALTARFVLGTGPEGLEFPYLLLLVSGGHCQLLAVEGVGRYRRLGTTLDDALGEAFDKAAKMLRLGFPGGPAVERAARTGDPGRFALPRPMLGQPGCNFSFSGLKTALLYTVRELGEKEVMRRRADLAASYQRAIVRALVERTLAAAEELGAERIAVVGGVAANSELRAALPQATLAPLALCTDNAAMIASAARYAAPIPFPEYLALDAYATAA